MHVDPPETSELEVFLAIVDQGSFAGAASVLGLPRATVSRRLKRLETRLGVRLLRRTTRQVALTPAGRDLDPHARRIVAAVREAAESVQRSEGPLRGLLRVSAPPGNFERFEQLLVEFLEQHPQVRLELERSTRQVDVVAGGFDVALRATSNLDPGLVARRLTTISLGAWASPSYLATRGHPPDVSALQEHDCLVGYARGERPAVHWPLLGGGHVAIRPRMASNDLSLLAAAASRGLGIALLPGPFAQEHGLEPVLPDQIGASSTLALVYADRHTSPTVRAFVDHVLAHREELLPSVSVR